MDLKTYLAEYFPNLTLQPPLFYEWDVAIRFELGNPLMFGINKEQYMERVYFRSLQLFKALHDQEDEVLLITQAYFADKPKHKVKNLNLYSKYIKKQEPIRSLRLEILPDLDYEPTELSDPKNNMYRYWTKCKVEDLKFSQLIKAICNHDVGVKPMITHRVYFINISKKTIFHIYDDRGCDVISASRQELMDIYKEFNHWILDYDRDRINNVFLG